MTYMDSNKHLKDYLVRIFELSLRIIGVMSHKLD